MRVVDDAPLDPSPREEHVGLPCPQSAEWPELPELLQRGIADARPRTDAACSYPIRPIRIPAINGAPRVHVVFAVDGLDVLVEPHFRVVDDVKDLPLRPNTPQQRRVADGADTPPDEVVDLAKAA